MRSLYMLSVRKVVDLYIFFFLSGTFESFVCHFFCLLGEG